MQSVSEAKYIRFVRFSITLLLFSFAMTGAIAFIYAVLFVAITILLFGTDKNILTLLMRFVATLINIEISEKEKRAFTTTRSFELFQESFRTIVIGIILVLYYNDYHTGAISIAYVMGILMMISSFFGFCMTSLIYIALVNTIGRFRGKA